MKSDDLCRPPSPTSENGLCPFVHSSSDQVDGRTDGRTDGQAGAEDGHETDGRPEGRTTAGKNDRASDRTAGRRPSERATDRVPYRAAQINVFSVKLQRGVRLGCSGCSAQLSPKMKRESQSPASQSVSQSVRHCSVQTAAGRTGAAPIQ